MENRKTKVVAIIAAALMVASAAMFMTGGQPC